MSFTVIIGGSRTGKTFQLKRIEKGVGRHYFRKNCSGKNIEPVKNPNQPFMILFDDVDSVISLQEQDWFKELLKHKKMHVVLTLTDVLMLKPYHTPMVTKYIFTDKAQAEKAALTIEFPTRRIVEKLHVMPIEGNLNWCEHEILEITV